MAAGILIARNNQQFGPYGEEKLPQLVANKEVAASDLAWREGMPEWKPLKELFPGLFVAPPPPPGGSAAGKMPPPPPNFEGQKAPPPAASNKTSSAPLMAAAAIALLSASGAGAYWYKAHGPGKEPVINVSGGPGTGGGSGPLTGGGDGPSSGFAGQPGGAGQGGFPPGQPGRGGQHAQGCSNCGVVESVQHVAAKSDGPGVGAVVGGVVGGLLGSQVGGGSGKKAATIAGAAGGAYLGHEIEKNHKGGSHYVVTVRMQDGKKQKLSFASAPSWRQGDQVMIQNGQLVAMR